MKIGRNEKCPCGSGEKYKNCCLNSGRNNFSSSPKNADIYPLNQYQYVIVFKGGNTEIVSPIVTGSISEINNEYNGRMHLFDPELVSILPAVSYCLQLPRFEWDTFDTISQKLTYQFNEICHDITVISSTNCSKVKDYNSTIVIYDDNCDESEVNTLLEVPTLLGCVPVSALNENLLIEHWKQLYKKRKLQEMNPSPELSIHHLLMDDTRLLLPLVFSSRFYGLASSIYGLLPISDDISKIAFQTMKNVYRTPDYQYNVVITFPGVSNRINKACGNTRVIPQEEIETIRLIAIHCAIAKGAIILELPQVSDSLFEVLNELELSFISNKNSPNNKSVMRTLHKMGKLLADQLTQEQLSIIKNAKHITAFTDFPIGLAILNGDDISLHCYKGVSYHPISPLTASFQFELPEHGLIDLTRKIKVLFAECISAKEDINHCDNEIRHCSNVLLSNLIEQSRKTDMIEVEYKETLSKESLLSFIKDNSDATILYISAHGLYQPDNNRAGLWIGDEDIWFAEDAVKVPPIVILSACHTNPRGTGCISVSNVLLQHGAVAVMGTNIPIDPHKNTFLISQLFTNIIHAQCHEVPFKNLMECWIDVTTENLITEFICESSSFGKWIMGQNGNGITRLEEFYNSKSVGRLHPNTILQDACNVLKEMLIEDGMPNKFDNLLSQKDYLPETSFYQWSGLPENMIIQA